MKETTERATTERATTVPGLDLIEDWITPDTEKALLAAIDASPWRDDLKRRVQHYGWRYDYKARRVDGSMKLGPLPEWAAVLARRIVGERRCEREPDQVTVNEYAPGQGISRHIDRLPFFGPTVLSLSLGSSCVIEMMLGASDDNVDEIALAPRSLLVLSGAARMDWSHGIPGRMSDVVNGKRVARGRRVSVTFRTVV